MTHRLLPPSDWPRLAGTALDGVWAQLPTDRACVLVVEDGAQIVGCWAFVLMLHAEGVWMQRTSPSIARHLLRGMREVAASYGMPSVWTGSATPEVAALCEGLGATQVPFTSWVIPMVGEERG